MKNIYLGKLGRAFGPYSEDEITEFERTGELRNFNWIWTGKAEHWVPLDPPPPPRPLHAAEVPARAPVRHDSLLPLNVICHNGRHAITGAIRLITEQGCELVCGPGAAEAPFAVPGRVILSILDEQTNQTFDVAAQIETRERKDGRWRYRISWQRVPKLVLNSLGDSAGDSLTA